jgi:predicted DNA binding CopG/RHH family protein
MKATKPDWRTLPRKAPDERRDERIEVRISTKELSRLIGLASESGVSLSQYVRNRALGKKLSSP